MHTITFEQFQNILQAIAHKTGMDMEEIEGTHNIQYVPFTFSFCVVNLFSFLLSHRASNEISSSRILKDQHLFNESMTDSE